ncbi:MAG: PqqD family protein [Bacteroidaceae bacterium]
MKLKDNLELRNVCGENVLIPCGIKSVDFNYIVHLNETGTFLWKEAQKGDFTTESLLTALLEEYEVCEEEARKDVVDFVEKLKSQQLVE